MEALYLLIPLSVVAIFAAAWVFLRMSDSGQFDDMDGPAWSVLHDDDRPADEGKEEGENQSEGKGERERQSEGKGDREGTARADGGEAELKARGRPRD